jgi:ADP-ribose pyrophosphatase
MREHGPWKVRSTRDIYRDAWVSLKVDNVIRPDGKPGTYAVIALPPGTCVIAIDDHGIVHLTEEFRYAIGRPSIEGAGGGMDEGEDPLAAARRELREELGIEAAAWTPLGLLDTDTSIVRGPVHLFLAEGLTFGTSRHEGTEVIHPVRMPLAEAVRAVGEGRIRHAPTCVALLQAAARHGSSPGPNEKSGGRRVRALVIEDNKDAAESLYLLLDQLGCEAAVAMNGPAGVEAARSSHPDIVFCDIGLPGLDGYGVARRIRSESWGARVVLVAVTGYGREEDRRQAEAAGFDMHFVKPADPRAITRLFKDVGLASSHEPSRSA